MNYCVVFNLFITDQPHVHDLFTVTFSVVFQCAHVYLFMYLNIFIQGKTQFSKILFFNAALFSEKTVLMPLVILILSFYIKFFSVPCDIEDSSWM